MCVIRYIECSISYISIGYYSPGCRKGGGGSGGAWWWLVDWGIEFKLLLLYLPPLLLVVDPRNAVCNVDCAFFFVFMCYIAEYANHQPAVHSAVWTAALSWQPSAAIEAAILKTTLKRFCFLLPRV